MQITKNERILSKNYWQEAAKQFLDTKMVVLAAIFIALRVAVKPLGIYLAGEALKFTFDCYVNSIGAMIYGPIMALAVGAVSDTLGFFLYPTGVYFFPFIFVEMASGFIFALFFWRRKATVSRSIAAKFTVNLLCNIILNPLILKWQAYITGEPYHIISLVRIAKNLVLFPAEALLIFVILSAVTPPLARFGILRREYASDEKIKPKHIIAAVCLLLLSVAIILFYIFYLKDFIKLHNIKFL